MGKFRAKVPTHLVYTKNHLWINKEGDVAVVGITHYKQRFFMDVEDISFSVDEGDTLEPGTQVATVEGVKAVAQIVAEFSGEISEINEELDLDPTLINASTYEYGWLMKVKGLSGEFLTPQEYLEFIEKDWEEAVEQIVQERGDGKILPEQ